MGGTSTINTTNNTMGVRRDYDGYLKTGSPPLQACEMRKTPIPSKGGPKFTSKRRTQILSPTMVSAAKKSSTQMPYLLAVVFAVAIALASTKVALQFSASSTSSAPAHQEHCAKTCME